MEKINLIIEPLWLDNGLKFGVRQAIEELLEKPGIKKKYDVATFDQETLDSLAYDIDTQLKIWGYPEYRVGGIAKSGVVRMTLIVRIDRVVDL